MNKTSSTQATPESVWAILQETAQQQKEYKQQHEKYAAEADKRFREADKRAAEADKRAAEADKRREEADKRREEYEKHFKEYAMQQEKKAAESEKEWKELKEFQAKVSQHIDKVSKEISDIGKNLGGLGNRIGEIMETLLAAGSWEKFKEYNYDFERAYQRVGIYNGKSRLTDIDILLSNGKYAMAVEVKNILNRRTDVDDHVERLDLLMQYPPAEIKGKKVMGAMACGVVDDRVRDYAFSKGLFVLELTGDAADLATPPANFTPQEWIPA
ncbi:hypothetical protein FACS1894195_1070 [Bacteroidia bacterium]|nr:hypothetical protein FACS1894195_1070 [Bacteroidia bacterium]